MDRPVTYPPHRRLLLAIVPPLAAMLIRLLAATLRYETISEPGAAPAPPDTRDIWCFWHNSLLTSACYFQGRVSAALLISPSFDGELIARTSERLGFATARGSSSRRGLSGLRGLERALAHGRCAVFPADGPRGPRYRLKPGAVKLAQRTGRLVGAFYALPERAWVLGSWDGLQVPKPFSRVAIAWALTEAIAPELDEAAFQRARLRVEAACERARVLSERHFAGDHSAT